MSNPETVERGCLVCHCDVTYEDNHILGYYFTCSHCGVLVIVPRYHGLDKAIRMVRGLPEPSEAGSYKKARGILVAKENKV